MFFEGNSWQVSCGAVITPHKEILKWLGSSGARNCWQLRYWNNRDLREFRAACSREGPSQNFVWWNRTSARRLLRAMMKLVWKGRLKWEGVSEALTELPRSGCSHLPWACTRSAANKDGTVEIWFSWQAVQDSRGILRHAVFRCLHVSWVPRSS